MRLSPLCRLHRMRGRYVLMLYQDRPQALEVNESFAFLWKNLSGKDFSLEDVSGLLVDHYALEPADAEEEARKIVSLWEEEQLMTSA